MPVTLVIGAQWGDEGKGRIVDFFAPAFGTVARFGGGANAGHTVRVGESTYKLRIVPSGAIAGVEHCIIGPGTVVSPAQFIAEISQLREAGVDVSRVWLSDLAHLVLPYHVAQDAAQERELGDNAIGTTGNGIGPAYVDRAARVGLRAGDLRDRQKCRSHIERRASALRRSGVTIDAEALVAELEMQAPAILPHVRDTIALLHSELQRGKAVLAEGAQGSMLDVNLGTYPYVTSSVTVAGGASCGLGFGPALVERVIGVAKAYATRVGGGPFPSEIFGAQAAQLRSAGAEFGVVTGRPRRCGWLDLAALKYAVAINGITELALTKLDVLDGLGEVQVCTGYEAAADVSLPFALATQCKPVYRTFEGWSTSTRQARSWDELPAAARAYVEGIEDALRVPVSFISVGAERAQIIVRSGAPLGVCPPALC